jgi:hypothetical protein
VKLIMQSAGLGILCATLIFGALGCNVDSTVTLVGQLATNLLNSCAAFGVNPVDQAACAGAATAIQAITQEIIVTHDAYTASKTSGTLAALKAAIAAGITKIPDILAAIHISNSGTISIITLAINLIVSTVQIIASAFGVASPVVSARLHAALPGIKSEKDIRTKWNVSVCGGLAGPALARCVV